MDMQEIKPLLDIIDDRLDEIEIQLCKLATLIANHGETLGRIRCTQLADSAMIRVVLSEDESETPT